MFDNIWPNIFLQDVSDLLEKFNLAGFQPTWLNLEVANKCIILTPAFPHGQDVLAGLFAYNPSFELSLYLCVHRFSG